jgi:predicted RNA-binding protein (virulence factor B family)
MKKKPPVGAYLPLTVARKTSDGFDLQSDDGIQYSIDDNETNKEWEAGSIQSLFTYFDFDQRFCATTLKPTISVGRFGLVEIVKLDKNGALISWGIDAPIYIPEEHQHRDLEAGKWYLATLCYSEENETLYASTKVSDYLSNTDANYKINEEVNIIFYEQTKLGYNVIVDHKHRGLIYHDEVYREISYGEHTKGYIKKIREENKLDVMLQPMGFARIDASEETILKQLKENNGFLALHDKSEAEDIILQLGMSKKTFKKAIGGLYKQKLVRLEDDGVYLK